MAKQQQEKLSLGAYLKTLREAKKLTLRDVEAQTEKEVSNAYLSQLENEKIVKPSPNILYSLAEIYGVSYEELMEKADYVVASNSRKDHEKHGRIATFAVGDKTLTKEEEEALLQYLSFLRSKNKSK